MSRAGSRARRVHRNVEVPTAAGPVAGIMLGLVLLGVAIPACTSGGAHEVEIAVGAGNAPYPFRFVASGRAVDTGLLCPGGGVEEMDARFDAAGTGFAENTFVCDDGSGSFVLETVIEEDPEFAGEGLPVSAWTVISGTGSYEELQGHGTHRYLTVEDAYPEGPLDAVLQVISGEVDRG